MGVYIAEAQRAKQMLQHSIQIKAAQAEHVHNKHDHALYASDLPEQPQLSQQQAQHESPGQNELGESKWSASVQTPPGQQAHQCQSPEHVTQLGLADIGQQSHDSADKSTRPQCYARHQVLSDSDSGKGDQEAAAFQASHYSSNSPSRVELHDGAQEPDAQVGGQSAAFPAAEPSFALSRTSPRFNSQRNDVEPSQPCSVTHTRMQLPPYRKTDVQPEEPWVSHGRQTASVMHESFWQGNCGSAASAPVERADGCICIEGAHGMKSLAGAEGRQLGSPNAAKFAFAR